MDVRITLAGGRASVFLVLLLQFLIDFVDPFPDDLSFCLAGFLAAVIELARFIISQPDTVLVMLGVIGRPSGSWCQ